MWTLRTRLFALTLSLFFFGLITVSFSPNANANASASKANADICCLAGMSCCYIPPGHPAGKSSAAGTTGR